MNPVAVSRGDSPVILAFPHTGTELDAETAAALNAEGKTLRDTDWHIHRLYADLLPGVTTVRALFHRYVIDANRDPSGDSLYPGMNTTGLCPTITFDDVAIYEVGREPDAAEIARRLETWHAVYHRQLSAEIERVREKHGVAILYDCHSIRSHIPFLFEGKLPDFNIGTNNGATCAPALETAVADICARADNLTSVLNGRFKGGWTTRHYGRPEEGVHAIQMELAQCTHLASEELPFDYDPEKAAGLRVHLKTILETLHELALSGALAR
ncbi:MAG: N-formylglutamate deformylase [Rhizobiales bacterium]|nr:N-formylglutamate deformylase [Hyphomicrobiales bacterium]MBA68407.1 N-formylglutamate deformylase [Hyphomicrobiales bacterium]|tara:strand:- start:230 stop:1036 length:807 start_codon:yes stop_codon:yes gene_type:complete